MNTVTVSSNSNRSSIGPEDAVTVSGRYLIKQGSGERFLMQGIAFPIPQNAATKYDSDAWIAVLEQLAKLSNHNINTVRVYDMDCEQHAEQYAPFLERAAELGIYVIIPLTSAAGHGDLDRNVAAPHCYSKKLYRYGTTCLDQFAVPKHPNVLAGVLGNEVMNTVASWKAAPCIAAYGRDLKQYMSNSMTAANNNSLVRTLPLMYAAQHDSLVSQIPPEMAMKQTADYLSCSEHSAIDIFGINVESWCSSLQTYLYNEDGTTVSGYYALHKALQNSSIPIVFSEMGCAKNLFDRDNGISKNTRDWKQVGTVLNEMSDVFSGFSAYAYSGNPNFDMMESEWDGHTVQQPGPDFRNFVAQLALYNSATTKLPIVAAVSTSASHNNFPAPSCQSAVAQLTGSNHVHLHERMPLYSEGGGHYFQFVLLIATVVVAVGFAYRKWKNQQHQLKRTDSDNYLSMGATSSFISNYQSINSSDEECSIEA